MARTELILFLFSKDPWPGHQTSEESALRRESQEHWQADDWKGADALLLGKKCPHASAA